MSSIHTTDQPVYELSFLNVQSSSYAFASVHLPCIQPSTLHIVDYVRIEYRFKHTGMGFFMDYR